MNAHTSKLKGLLWVSIACLLAIGFAVGLAPLAHLVPFSWEKKLGYLIGPDLLQREYPYNFKAHALLQKLVKRIYPIQPDDQAFVIDVNVINDSNVNAFATLGGNIFITSGLLKKAGSPEEVAGVLAHEIAHLQHRHIMEGTIVHLLTVGGVNMICNKPSSAAEWASYFLRMDFTRDQEIQADESGLKRLQKAHVDNQGFKQFFERMEISGDAPTFLSDHPSNQARIDMTEKFKNQDIEPIMTPEEWKFFKNYYRGLN